MERRPEPTIQSEGQGSRGFADEDWGTRQVPSQALAIRLPQASQWQAAAPRGSWAVFLHQPTQSQLLLRHEVARRNISAHECEQDIRYSLEELHESSEALGERREVLSNGYHGFVRVVLQRGGQALVKGFFAGVSRCLSVVFIPRSGAGDPETLQLVSDRVVPAIQILGVATRASQPRSR